MLILTRRISESLYFFDEEKNTQSKVIVLGIKGNQVRLGVEAPKNINILRDELLTRLISKTTISEFHPIAI